MKNKKRYSHLNQSKRDRLQVLLEAGHTQEEIAKVLEVNQSTVSREIERNRKKIRRHERFLNGPYLTGLAQHKAYLKRKYSKYQGKKINEEKGLRNFIIKGLRKYWSPDGISGRLKLEEQPFYASKNAIYQWLYTNRGQYWCKYLYSKRYRKRKRIKKKTKKTLIPNRIGLELRPKEISLKLEYGHYEGDTMVSTRKTASKEALSVSYERKAKYLDARKIESLSPRLNNQALKEMKEQKVTKSYTFDNGLENRNHQELGVSTYFCDPYSAWQKGGVENAIKMIRWFIPKGKDIASYSDDYVRMIVNILNQKPRKSLGYLTPLEVMIKNNLLLKTNKISLEIKKPEYALRG